MNNFKVGDRVRVVKKPPVSSVPSKFFENNFKGKCGSITKIFRYDSFPYVVQLDGDDYDTCFRVNELTLLEKKIPMSKFNVGDIVLWCNDDYSGSKKSGVVTGHSIFKGVRFCNVRLQFEDNEIISIGERWLKAVDNPAPKEGNLNLHCEKENEEDIFGYIVIDYGIKKVKIVCRQNRDCVILHSPDDDVEIVANDSVFDTPECLITDYWKDE